MESATRQRKGKDLPRRKNQKVVDRGISQNDGTMSMCSIFLSSMFILFSILLVINFFWPPPKLSKSVKQWRDAGFYFRFRNYEIFYQDIRSPDYNPDSDPVLLAIHGFPTSSYDWKLSLPAFGKYFHRIVVPDLLGLGFSSKPSPYNYTISEHADIITALLFELSITEVHIVAQDIGTNIAQEFLTRQQDSSRDTKLQIKSLCLSDGPVLSTHYKHQPIQKVLLHPYLKHIAPYLLNRYLFFWRFNAVTGVPLPRHVLDDVYAILMVNDGYLAAPYVLYYIPEIFQIGPVWEKALEETKIPVHLIFGPHDPTSSYEEFLVEYKKRFPHSTVTYVETAGHFINMETPDEFMAGFEEYARLLGMKPLRS